jgi:hypothetical protein
MQLMQQVAGVCASSGFDSGVGAGLQICKDEV